MNGSLPDQLNFEMTEARNARIEKIRSLLGINLVKSLFSKLQPIENDPEIESADPDKHIHY